MRLHKYRDILAELEEDEFDDMDLEDMELDTDESAEEADDTTEVDEAVEAAVTDYEEDFEEDYEGLYEDNYEDVSDDAVREDSDGEVLSERKRKRNSVNGLLIGFAAVILVLLAVAIGALVRLDRTEGAAPTSDGGVAYTTESTAERLLAITDLGKQGCEAVAQRAEEDALLAAELQAQEEARLEAERLEQERLEAEANRRDIEVALNYVSIEKDLKLKFTNPETGKLLALAAFTVELKDAAGNVTSYTDEDMDGVIYISSIEAGKYTARILEKSGFAYSADSYKLSVKDKIEYVKVDVKDEIKTEKDVNLKEDDKKEGIEQEEVLKDTVEWVASSKTPIGNADGYEPIQKSAIAEPSAVLLGFTLLASENPARFLRGDVVSPAVTSMTLNSDNVTLKLGGATFTLTATLCFDDSTEITSPNASYFSFASSDPGIVTVSPDGVLTAVAKGSAVVTATSLVADSTGVYPSATCSVTVTNGSITVSLPGTAQATAGITGMISATVTVNGVNHSTDGTSATEGFVTWTSSNTSVATVDASTGKITTLAAGETTITATSVETDASGNPVSASVVLTVGTSPKDDHQTKLTDSQGRQVYIKSGQNFKEATLADYYTATEFYTKGEVQYTYTGWQTINGKTYYYKADGQKVQGEQVIQGVKYTFNTDCSLNIGTAIRGIDVSSYNKNIDWKKVKDSGIEFVIIRVGFRGTSTGKMVEDSYFKSYIKGATDAGLNVGLYFFSQAITEAEAIEEASMALELVNGYKLRYPIFIDTEPSGGRGDKMNATQRTAVCKAFCQTIVNGGYKAGIYASKSYFLNNIKTSELSAYTIWVAQYASECTYTGRYDMWQYSSKGTVPGISGAVDLDYSYFTY